MNAAYSATLGIWLTVIFIALAHDSVSANAGSLFGIIEGNIDSSGYPQISASIALVDTVSGRPVTELDQTSFSVTDSSGLLPKRSITRSPDSLMPVAYVVLIDTGVSMQPYVEDMKDQLSELLASLGANDVVRIVKFNTSVDVIGTNWVRNNDPNLLSQIASLQTVAEDSLMSQAYVRAAEVTNSAPDMYSRRAIISFIGIDDIGEDGGLSLDVIASSIQAVSFIFSFGIPPKDREQLSVFLQDIADYTGGAYWPLSVIGMSDTPFDFIRDVMRAVWTVTFVAEEFPDGAQHEFRVQVSDVFQRTAEVSGSYTSGRLGAVSPIDIEGIMAGESIQTDRDVVVRLAGSKHWESVGLELYVDCQAPGCNRPVATGNGVVEWKLRASDFSPGRHRILVVAGASGPHGEFSDTRALEFVRAGTSWDLAPAAMVLGIALVAAVTTVGLARRRAVRA